VPDNLTPEQRSYCMSRIKGWDTGLEKLVRSQLHRRGFRFRKHVKDLPGRPDIVLKKFKVVVFVDGDFWHGYRFPRWKDKVSRFWKIKISKNRARDIKNRRKLRNMKWTIVRLWQHDVEKDLAGCIERVIFSIRNSTAFRPSRRTL
jgi:DNA mismatch endonuclease (patch repair protein)